MLTFEQIKELVELVDERGLGGLEIERSGFRLKIDGQSAGQIVAASPTPVVEVAPAAPAPGASAPVESAPAVVEPSISEDVHVIKSPIVGTFYSAPSPDASAYVKVGDRVEKGQVLCIIEAMKLMNEIESDVDGVVTEIFPKNAQAVEFGEALFAVDRA